MDIQLLPAPPTDNLYKFMAIFGAWTLLILAVFMMGVDYLVYKSKEEMQQTVAYYRATDNIQHIQDRLAAIQAGQLNKAIVWWAPIHDGSKAEKIYLQNDLQLNQAYLNRHQGDDHRHDAKTYWKIFSAIHAIVYILVLGGIGIFCLVSGFYRWWRVQRISDDMLLDQQNCQKMTNKKLKLELETMATPSPPTPATAPAPEPAPAPTPAP